MSRIHHDRRLLPAWALAAAVASGAGLQAPTTDAQTADAQPADAPSARAESPNAPQPADATVSPLLTRSLAGIDGKEVSMAVVEYGPGGASAPHRHNANVFVYVLEGRVVMQVAGGEEVTLSAGQTFYESPADIHAVSRNASDTEPAKILAFLVKDEGAPTTVPAD